MHLVSRITLLMVAAAATSASSLLPKLIGITERSPGGHIHGTTRCLHSFRQALQVRRERGSMGGVAA